ncbi:MAG: helix-turn-helix domain-containing protein [Oscillospiraceae bacterium]|nr:helix-turn-helix domain-containing protein [Oscillospiraceae bacterium]
MNNMNLGEKIYSLRKLKQLSQDELAEKLYISKQTVAKWEEGISTPEIDKLIIMGKIFEVPAEYFLKSDNLNNKDNSNNKTEKTRLIFLIKYGSILALLSLLGFLGQYLLYLLEIIKERYSVGCQICFALIILGAVMVISAKLMMKYTFKKQYYSMSKAKIIGISLTIPAIILIILTNYIPNLLSAILCFSFCIAFAGINIFDIIKKKYV